MSQHAPLTEQDVRTLRGMIYELTTLRTARRRGYKLFYLCLASPYCRFENMDV